MSSQPFDLKVECISAAKVASQRDGLVKSVLDNARPLKAFRLDPNFLRAHFYLAFCYVAADRHKEALEELNRLRQFQQIPVAIAALHGVTYARMGRRREAENMLADLRNQVKQHFVPPGALARIYIALGEQDHAFELLGQAAEGHDQLIVNLRVDPTFDPLRSDPRFKELLARVGLAQ